MNAFQNAVFAGCSSSDVSMSGTTSACTVGVNCWSSPSFVLDRLRERELEVVQERERVLAHHDDQLRLDDVQLARQPAARLVVGGAAGELDAVRAVDGHRVDAQPLERLEDRLPRAPVERDALLCLGRRAESA